MIDLTPVSSSNIDSVGYDLENKEMYVKFLNGTMYKYYEVEESVYDSLVSAASVGAYFNQNVKHAYSYERMD